MLLASLAVVGGFVFLVWGADRFVLGASATARNLGVSPLVIGLTIVGFGTSAPELLVSAVASVQDKRGLAVGNALGSNITNIALVLGATALVSPLTMHSNVLRRELPILVASMFVAGVLIIDGDLSRGDGVLLLAGLGMMLYWLISVGLRSRSDPITAEFVHEMPARISLGRAVFWLALGLAVLFVSSRIVVWGAVEVALGLGVSDLVIGLTVIAIGTSLPELVAAVVSGLKNEHDIAIGNVIGSNMFNLLGVMGIPGVIAPGLLEPEVLTRDYPLMLGLTVALFVMAYGVYGRPGRINRVEGGALLGIYTAYLAIIYHMSIQA